MDKQDLPTAYFYDPLFLKHDQLNHPENAERLVSIHKELSSANIPDLLQKTPKHFATIEEMKMVHSENYINEVKKTSLLKESYLDQDTYTTSFSWDAATLAAGSLIKLTLEIIEGRSKNGFALVRPPGHHAIYNRGMGFCLFNNVAIAARAAQNMGGVQRVAIIDFDVHHGNGTQAIFDEDPDVLFISSHSYPFYPGSGNMNDTGSGTGKGSTINLPFSSGIGDEGVKTVYSEIIPEALERFQPEFIIVSAGYDAHWCDPIGNLNITSYGFTWISKFLLEQANKFCNGKIVFSLEGGYHLEALAEAVTNTIKVLMKRDDFKNTFGESNYSETPITEDYIKTIKRIHRLI